MDEKEFDFGHLTKEQALYLHRKLWNTIADKILEFGIPVEKWEIFLMYEWPKIHADCWCCEYGRQQYAIDGISSCVHCPIRWTSENKYCHSFGSPYDKWNTKMIMAMWPKRTNFNKTEIEELAGLARQIAELPEKE